MSHRTTEQKLSIIHSICNAAKTIGIAVAIEKSPISGATYYTWKNALVASGDYKDPISSCEESSDEPNSPEAAGLLDGLGFVSTSPDRLMERILHPEGPAEPDPSIEAVIDVIDVWRERLALLKDNPNITNAAQLSAELLDHFILELDACFDDEEEEEEEEEAA